MTMALKDWKKTTYGWKKDTTDTNGTLAQIILSTYGYANEGAYSVRIESITYEKTHPYNGTPKALLKHPKILESKEKAIAFAKDWMRKH